MGDFSRNRQPAAQRRKKRLARLLAGRRLGIVLSDTDEDGGTIFRHACPMGLEGSCRSG
jgi:hypothetical protein